MEQLAHFVTKSFEYNNNRVMDVINMTQNSRSVLCGDPFRSVGSVDRISVKSVHRMDDEGSSGLDDEEDTMDIDITDFSSDDESAENAIKDRRCSERDGALLRLSTTNCRNTVGRVQKEEGLNKVVLSGLLINSATDGELTQTLQRDLKKKHATKNWLISDSPKRTEERGKFGLFDMFTLVHFNFFLQLGSHSDADTDVALNLICVDQVPNRNFFRTRQSKEMIQNLESHDTCDMSRSPPTVERRSIKFEDSESTPIATVITVNRTPSNNASTISQNPIQNSVVRKAIESTALADHLRIAGE